MGNINRVPLGLLSLLDSQTQGQAPATMTDDVQASFDLGAFWLNSRGMEIIQVPQAPAVTAAGQSTTFATVPEGEIWCVVSAVATAFVQDAVPQIVQLTYQLSSATANQQTLASSDVFTPGAVVGFSNRIAASMCWSTAEPFLARAGSRFGTFLTIASAVALPVGTVLETGVIFYRLKV